MLLNNKDHIQTLQPQTPFYRAVVEDNEDPDKNGRCRVRILGVHPQNAKRSGKNRGVPVDELPWAEVIGSLGFHGGVSGIGISAVPLKGSWVWVFFDGGDWNTPIISGLIHGISTETNPDPKGEKGGFHDPDAVYPIKDRLNEPDQNRLTDNRKFNETPIFKIRKTDEDKATPTVTGQMWDEMGEKTSKAKYPHNTVIETDGHSFIEYDSTPGNERIHFFHKSGSYWEIQEEGHYQMKIRKDKQLIVDGDEKNLIKKNRYTTIRKNDELKIDGNEDIFIGKNLTETINGNVDETYNGKETKYVALTFDEEVGTNKTVKVGANMEMKAGGNADYKSGGIFTIKGAIINLN